MDYGAKYIRWARFAAEVPEPAGKLPNYDKAVTLGSLNKVSETIAYNEAKGYGDNVLKVHVSKFKEAALAVEITEVPRDAMSQVSGASLDEAGDKNMRFRVSDKPPYGGMAFYVNKILDDDRDVCMGIFYPKTKATLQGSEYNTNGENITLTNRKLQFTASACNSGEWRIESDYFDTEEEAKAWVDKMLSGDGGEE